ncbi:MAG TPA: LysM peptidoglycan-binding domain-containing protein [Ferruginibacter sp.]|nr:LysM peptidoglycan-binding domain-containing protein [Ferruginibacter sp.]
MKIKTLLAVLCIFISISLRSQDLTIQGTAPKLHLVHKVAPKENWYSIGRLYNVSPKELAPYNGLKMEAPLSIGQMLKVPLGETNFSQTGAKAGDEALVPLFHTVQEKEWMYRISQNYNKVPVEKLQQWNKISNDNLKPGMKLIVGYLKVKANQSALASGAKQVPVNTTTPTVASNKPVMKDADVAAKKEVPAEKKDVAVEKKEIPAEKKDVPAEKKEVPEKKDVAVEKKEVVTEKKEPAPEKKEAVDKPDPVAKNENKPVVPDTRPVVNKTIDYNGGFFRPQFGASGKITNGVAGIFKSTSGWQDGKYYALMNNVPVGTIIKIDHPITHKSVYAKVLGQLPDMKESSGLAIRLSDAAAAELGAAAYKFNVEVSY